MKQDDLRAVFTDIQHSNAWGGTESVSGPGSGRARTLLLRRDLSRLVETLAIGSLLDAACGDFHWMQETVLPGLRYIGVDIVPEIIARNQERYGGPGREFVVRDITCDRLPRVDLILCRDCLVHLPWHAARATIANFRRSGSTYLLATTFVARTGNTDIPAGAWTPMNLALAPFDFPPPLALIDERCPPDRGDYADKRLALWRLDQLPSVR